MDKPFAVLYMVVSALLSQLYECTFLLAGSYPNL